MYFLSSHSEFWIQVLRITGRGQPLYFILAVRSTSLFKLENRNWKRLVQKPNWTRFMGKSENVYSGTRTFWLFRDQTNIKSVYRSTYFQFAPKPPSNLASVPISSNFDFPA
jgi:hypothetical protein